MRMRMRVLAIVGACAALLAVAPGAPALAFTDPGPGGGYTPADCLSGAAGPYTVVGTWRAIANGKSIQLQCGDPTKGVLHIDASHPIVENIDGTPTDGYFSLCMYYIFHYGRVIGTGNTSGSHVYSVAYGNMINSDEARAVVRDSDGYILTAWPNTYVGDFNWYACAVAAYHQAP
jgi:hypothetical protein